MRCKITCVTVFLILANVTIANACVLSENLMSNPDPTMNCSYYTKEFAERALECIHWAGEYAYDSERSKQIEKSIKRLHCDKIENDGKKLLKFYDNQPDNQEVIRSIMKYVAEN